MKKIYLILAFTQYACALFAQKKSLTLSAINDWPTITNEKISNDGKVAIYRINKTSVDDTLVIQSVDNRWIEKIPGGAVPIITENNQLMIYRKRDSLFLYDIQKKRLRDAVGQMISFKTPEEGNGQWLAWLQTDKKLVLCDCNKDQRHTWNNVTDYQFSANGKALLLQYQVIDGKDTQRVVQWIDLANVSQVTLMKNARNARHFIFDAGAEQLAFLADEIKNEKTQTIIRYYAKGMDSAVVRVTNSTPGLDTNYEVTSGIRFSPNGRRLIISLKKKFQNSGKLPGDQADVSIWHFDDDYLMSERAVNQGFIASRVYTAVLLKGENKLLQIDQEKDERFIDWAGQGDYNVVLVRNNMNYFAGKWKETTVPAYFLVNIESGQRKLIISQREISIYMSPAGKYVIWYDPLKKTWFTYSTTGGQITDITAQLTGTLMPRSTQGRLQPFLPYGIAGWLANDEGVFIYDEFDIWKFDPAGEKAPVNMTNGYGKRHHTVLRLWNKNNIDYAIPVIDKTEQVLIAFDTESKNNGFFKTTFTKAVDPVKLSLDPYQYYSHLQFNLPFMEHYSMIKAKNASAYIVRRMNSREYPNIYYSKDLRKFAPMSQVNPHQDYNWLTSELITWKQPDGTASQGLLYKPENFDSTKKYPVIFYLYEKFSHRLHQYLDPELSSGSLNIPYFVSNGYLVCTPDISYTPGFPGESANNAVVSAARYLSGFSFVDSTKMGLQGHSFGGYQVNYLIANTNLFAAAQESAGASDFISYYNGFYREHSAQFYFEYGQGRIGHTLWEKPELYIQNSPIFKADKVQTPLLIMHNKNDGEVPFQQGIEWFTALRRSGKKVWMLQYDKEYHGIDNTRNQTDFTLRMMEFFDHYLKGTPPPNWLIYHHPLSTPEIHK